MLHQDRYEMQASFPVRDSEHTSFIVYSNVQTADNLCKDGMEQGQVRWIMADILLFESGYYLPWIKGSSSILSDSLENPKVSIDLLDRVRF